eukprot:gb/GECG01004495.1/.p1 GENE.gb/GECG01004495.1/~~gb/GECG01004495.1/.p1  ORF type:complete len:722 (+),score=97.19 gb/GECG01004495.1/:1-2166(+)
MRPSVQQYARKVSRPDRDRYEWIGDALLGETLCRVVLILRRYLPIYGVGSLITPYQRLQDFISEAMTNKNLSEALRWVMQQEEKPVVGNEDKLSMNSVLNRGKPSSKWVQELKTRELPPLATIVPDTVVDSQSKSTIKAAGDLLESYVGWLMTMPTKRRRKSSIPTLSERLHTIDLILAAIIQAQLMSVYAEDDEVSGNYFGYDGAMRNDSQRNQFDVLEMGSSSGSESETEQKEEASSDSSSNDSSSSFIALEPDTKETVRLSISVRASDTREQLVELLTQIDRESSTIGTVYYYVGRQVLRCRVSCAVWLSYYQNPPSVLTRKRQRTSVGTVAKESVRRLSNEAREYSLSLNTEIRGADLYLQSLGAALVAVLDGSADSLGDSNILGYLLAHADSKPLNCYDVKPLSPCFAMHKQVDGNVFSLSSLDRLSTTLPLLYDTIVKPFENAICGEERYQRELQRKAQRTPLKLSEFERHIQRLTQELPFRRLDNSHKSLIKSSIERYPAYVFALESICSGLRSGKRMEEYMDAVNDEEPSPCSDESSDYLLGCFPFVSFEKILCLEQEGEELWSNLQVRGLSSYRAYVDCSTERDSMVYSQNAFVPGLETRAFSALRETMKEVSTSERSKLLEKFGERQEVSAQACAVFFDMGIHRKLAHAISDYYGLKSSSLTIPSTGEEEAIEDAVVISAVYHPDSFDGSSDEGENIHRLYFKVTQSEEKS